MSRLLLFCAAALPPACVVHLDASARERASREDHYEYPAEGLAALRLATRNGSIEVEAGGERVTCEVKFSAAAGSEQEARELVERMTLRDRVDGDALVLELDAPQEARNAGAALRLRLPARLALELRTSNGFILVQGPFPAVDASSSNGSIQAEARGGPVRLRSSNGRLELRGTPGAVDLDTSNGAILLALEGDWSAGGRAETSNGAITVTCSGALGCTVSADTSNAGVRVAGGELRMVGSPRDADGPHLALDTSNGTISILLNRG